jgi:hypothetical protein
VPVELPVTHPTKLVMNRTMPHTVFVTTRRMAAPDQSDASGHLLRCLLA